MRKVFISAILLLSGVHLAGAQTLNCNIAFTPLEHAICGHEELLQSYRRLERLILSSNDADFNQIKDGLARTCRSADALTSCLQMAVSGALSYRSEITESSSIEYDGPPAEARLRRQLNLARADYQETAIPDRLVASLLALLQHYQQQPPTESSRARIGSLNVELVHGCNAGAGRKEWNQVLQTYGRMCPLSYASME